MHRRHVCINVPTEIVRSVVSIAETGSFSRSAERLGLSQPAISAQIKRLQTVVGGAVFEKTARGVTFTPLGQLVLAQARKLIDANDQILSLGGSHRDRPLRLGLAAHYAERFVAEGLLASAGDAVHILCDHSSEIAKGLLEGYVDVACLMAPPAGPGRVLQQWTEPFAWVRSRSFVLSPGAPIPLVSWPGSCVDRFCIAALEQANLAYRVAFTSSDPRARLAAVHAGLGVMALPPVRIPSSLVAAADYYLPPLAPLPAGIVVSEHCRHELRDPAVEALRKLAPATTPRIKPHPGRRPLTPSTPPIATSEWTRAQI